MNSPNRVIYCILTPTFEPNRIGVKIGYTQNIFNRLPIYYTHNPFIKILGTIQVYQKTKHKLETLIHNEIIEQGFEFVKICGIRTEWFIVDTETEFYKTLITNGPCAIFKSCKGRKFERWST
jgi:hypothetical protein